MVLDNLLLKGKVKHYQKKKNPLHNTFSNQDIGNHHSKIFRATSFLIKSQSYKPVSIFFMPEVRQK